MSGGIHGHSVAGSTNASLGDINGQLEESNTQLEELNTTQTEALEQIQAIVSAVQGSGTISLTSGTVSALETAFTNANAGVRTDLSVIADDLNNILAELLEKIEAGEDVGLTDEAITALATAIATLFHYPTDYPNAQAHTDALSTNTKLDTLHTDTAGVRTDLGTDGISPPALPGSATGVRGWLRGILAAIQALPTTTPQTNALTDTQLRATPVPVSGTVTALPSLVTTAITSATVDVDTANYPYVSFQLIGATFNVVPEQSDDQTNYVNAPYILAQQVTATPTVGAIANGAGHYEALVTARYFRIRFVSGTVTGSITRRTDPTHNHSLAAVYNVSGTPLVVDTELSAAVTPADTLANSTAQTTILSYLMGFNNAAGGWDRLRSGLLSLGAATGRLGVNTNPVGTNAFTSPVSTAVAGNELDAGTVFSKWAIQVTMAGTTPTATVVLEGRLSSADTTYTTLATWTSTSQANGETIWVQDRLVRFVRARVTAISGTSATVQAVIAGGIG